MKLKHLQEARYHRSSHFTEWVVEQIHEYHEMIARLKKQNFTSDSDAYRWLKKTYQESVYEEIFFRSKNILPQEVQPAVEDFTEAFGPPDVDDKFEDYVYSWNSSFDSEVSLPKDIVVQVFTGMDEPDFICVVHDLQNTSEISRFR
jgi:hypothetical protein